MRIIKRFLAGLSLVGVATLVVLAPGAAGSTRSLADTGAATVSVTADSTVSVTADSMVWDTVAVPVS